MSSVKHFYNEFSERQAQVGINHRHLSIMRWLETFGLKKNHRVLEIGCGVGTVTELILRFLDKEGYLLGIDISDESIHIAKKRLNKYENLSLLAGDVITMNMEGTFDVIVLPDVIEHIPLELHIKLFKVLKSLLNPEGFIMIHIPDPFYLEWCIKNKASQLQIIDQPVPTHTLSSDLIENGLTIRHLESYSIYSKDSDYQVIKVESIDKKRNYEDRESYLNDSFSRRITSKLKYIIRGKR